MDLLEVIFGNFAFILVLFWLLNTLLGRRTKGNQNTARSERRSPHIPDTMESQSEDEDLLPDFMTIEEPEMRPEEPQRSESDRNRFHTKRSFEADRPIASMMTEKKVGSEEERARLDFKRMSAQSVVHGYIWSEIFGEPRAKRPHLLTRPSRAVHSRFNSK